MIFAIVKLGSPPVSTGLVPVEEFRKAGTITEAIQEFCSEYTPPKPESEYMGSSVDGLNHAGSWAWDFDSSSLISIVYKNSDAIPYNLDSIKSDIVSEVLRKRNSRIDNHEVLAQYPASSGKFFSCSEYSQNNWVKLETLLSLNLVEYPYNVRTHDYKDSYDVMNVQDLETILAAIASTVLAERSSAQGVLSSVLSAEDEQSAVDLAAPYLEQ